ncbi:hypothetical protein [Plasmodium yoelii yoelii]|uniref:Uncharacterized protein n=1 Tax=Plasmodium yoelii yoelii TaxID=73239 RepID=Q7RQB0_PLAYO|nr:hypothetical protein [Plasmodium yoelii yoelii]
MVYREIDQILELTWGEWELQEIIYYDFFPLPPEPNDKWSDGGMYLIGINYKVLFGGNIYGREDKLR